MSSLQRLGQILRENPDTGTGVQIRALLWSLYNQHHVVNLWTLCSRLHGEAADLASEVLGDALAGRLQDSDVKQVLADCGEFNRWDREQFPQALAEVRRSVLQALLLVPPSDDHTRLKDALRALDTR